MKSRGARLITPSTMGPISNEYWSETAIYEVRTMIIGVGNGQFMLMHDMGIGVLG